MRLIIVSNRLPFKATSENGELVYSPSNGGIVSSLGAYLNSLKKGNYLWVGWPGSDFLSPDHNKVKDQILKEKNALPIFLEKEVKENFYEGFCNKIIWPLFHYFTSYGIYNPKYWEDYKKVNQQFAEEILKIVKKDDIVWIHDYHLMLLPKLLRDARPDLKIGFFMHIPFPSSEVFSLLPSQWRQSILEGVLGSDVIGFHTQEYTHYFLSSVLRVLGFEHTFGNLTTQNRKVLAKAFPLGIDFDLFHGAIKNKDVIKEKNTIKRSIQDYKIILSIDRLDYTKGLINRLKGYEKFLQDNPNMRKKVVMVLVLIPSRTSVDQYQLMKKEIEEKIASINGLFGNVGWTPILYQFGSLNFNQLIAHYNLSDIALITPLRDGMNLVAKEYIAAKGNKDEGVLILSEKAGASKELSEAIIINPNSEEEIAQAIKKALEIPKKTQQKKIKMMQDYLKENTVYSWAGSFLNAIKNVKEEQKKLEVKQFTSEIGEKILKSYKEAKSRLLFLDYDGTLVPFSSDFSNVKPSFEVTRLLTVLAEDSNNEIVMISGRDKQTLEKWFGHLPVNLVGEHGLYLREKGANWKLLSFVSGYWKKDAKDILNFYCRQLPGTTIEEKDYSLAWHYRKANQLQASDKAKELLDDLVNFTANKALQILHGNKVIEIKPINTNKGTASARWIEKENFDFILAIGDDKTDEDLFSALPDKAYSIKVGTGQSVADYNISQPEEVIKFLRSLIS